MLRNVQCSRFWQLLDGMHVELTRNHGTGGYFQTYPIGIIGIATVTAADFVCRLKSVRCIPAGLTSQTIAAIPGRTDNKYLLRLRLRLRLPAGSTLKLILLSSPLSAPQCRLPIWAPCLHSDSAQVGHVLGQTRHDKLPGECLGKCPPKNRE